MKQFTNQSDISAAVNRVLTDPGFVIKTASSAIPKNGAAFTYTADGEFKSKTVDTDFPLTGADCNTKVPTGYTCLFVLCVKASDGSVKVFQSKQFLSNTALLVNKGGRDDNGNPVNETHYKVFRATKNSAGATALQEERGTVEYMSDVLPAIPAEYIPAGVVKVVNAQASADFTPGTTALDAANVTVTYTDIGVLPQNKNF
jgi:hypothetical protein